ADIRNKTFSRKDAKQQRKSKIYFAPLRLCVRNPHLSLRSFLLGLAVVALAWWNQRDIDGFVGKDRTLSRILRNRTLQKILIITIRKLGFVVRAARLVAIQSAQRNHARELEHVGQMARMRQRHGGPKIRIVDRDAFVTVHQLEQLVVSGFELVVVTDDGDVVSHPLAHLMVQHILVLVPTLLDQLIVNLLLEFQLLIVDTRTISAV